MFKPIAALVCLAIVCGFGMAIFPVRQKDFATYEDLLKSSRPDESRIGALSYSQQRREHVRKHIWYQDDSPLYFCIDSEESELFFLRQDSQVEVVEQLSKVICLMQEELYYEGEKPMQKVRYLEAEKACYNYNSHLFVAEDAKLWKYHLAGHEPPEYIDKATPVMRAIAQSVEFSLKGNKLDFTAYKMRAFINSEEKSL